jgi:hypothetical protein
MKYIDTAPAMVLNYATQPGLISPSNQSFAGSD